MPQLNLPKKLTSMGQLWLSILLIVLAAIFAFTPIVSLDMSDDDLWAGFQEARIALIEEIPELATLAKPEDEIGISSMKVITSVSIFTKIISLGISNANNDEDAQEKADDLAKLLESKDGQEAVIMMLAIVAQFVDFDTAFEEAVEGEEEESTGFGTVIQTLLKIVIVFYLLIYIAIWPFVLAIIAIINVLRAVKNVATPEKVAGKVGGVLVGPFAFTLTLTFLLTFLPKGFGWGAGLTTIFVCSIISIFANVVMTRLRAYNSLDFKYATLVQGTALVQGIGFIVFFSNMLKSNLLFQFFDDFTAYLYRAGLEIDAINSVISAYNSAANQLGMPTASYATFGAGYLLDLLLMLIFMGLALGVIGTVIKAVINRLTLTSTKGGLKAPLSAAIMAFITAIIPMVVGKMENAKTFTLERVDGVPTYTSKTVGSIFTMSAESSSAVTGMLIGAIIMLVAAIAFIVLKNIFCAEIVEAQEIKVLAGQADAYDPKGND